MNHSDLTAPSTGRAAADAELNSTPSARGAP